MWRTTPHAVAAGEPCGGRAATLHARAAFVRGRSQPFLSDRCFDATMSRLKRLFAGGSAGNRQLTALAAALLLLLLAIEGATLLHLGSLLTVHAFVGMLLIPIVALKLASTGWRMLRYYLGAAEYIRQGPPHVVLRAFVAPVVVLSTVVLFGTGVTLLALGQTSGTVVGLHKASFVVWLGATGVHVLAHATRVPGFLRTRVRGTTLRLSLVATTVAAGTLLATATLPAADRLQDRASAQIGLDAH